VERQHARQAQTPPMGWNSWNAFGADIDETKLMASARLLVDSGLAAKGYRYVDIDDGWWPNGACPMAACWCARRPSLRR
jgi:alpha-galactosidase